MGENWICNHLGARAHYEIPKALQLKGKLKYLLTEFWLNSHGLHKYVPSAGLKKVFQRSNNAIPDNKVRSFNTSSLLFEISQKVSKVEGWEGILNRNEWYQEKICQQLKRLDLSQGEIFFSFAYTSLKPMQISSSKGLKNILYQMDPGLYEEQLVLEEYEKLKIGNSQWKPAPAVYWKRWKEECEVSDKILVNSAWSLTALENSGISRKKIEVLPLPYSIPEPAYDFVKRYPDKFDRERPLKVLFLGTLTVRKGFHKVLKVAERLKGKPIEFFLVGNKEFDFPLQKNIKYYSHISREETAEFYKQSDIFLFPTLSDGFGLTQLEAMAWKLPIISSKFCGEVVVNGQNGMVLDQNSVDEIEQVLIDLSKAPEQLELFSHNCFSRMKDFNHESFANGLINIEE